MRIQNLIIIILASVVMTGCAGCETETNPKGNINSNKTPVKTSPSPSNTNRASNTNTPDNRNPDEDLGVNRAEKPKEINKAETITPLVDAFCKAVNSQNDAELQKVYSKQAWQTMQKYARDEGESSVAKFLNENEPVGKNCKVINEKLTGNTGVAYVSTQTYPNGIELKFVKEGNEWKMTTQTTEF